MRIISGKYRSKIIIAPGNLPSRPTTDFAKEALFNVLQNRFYLDEIDVLDLFAGTGNISYEFASRETPSITAVDSSHHCVKFISQTAEKLDFNAIKAMKTDALQFLSRAYQKWDVIFADPPYEYEDHLELVNTVMAKGLLKEDGILIIEHGKKTKLDEHPDFKDERKYGNVHFSFFYLDSSENSAT